MEPSDWARVERSLLFAPLALDRIVPSPFDKVAAVLSGIILIANKTNEMACSIAHSCEVSVLLTPLASSCVTAIPYRP